MSRWQAVACWVALGILLLGCAREGTTFIGAQIDETPDGGQASGGGGGGTALGGAGVGGAGPAGTALEFSGSQIVHFGAVPAVDDLTIELWLKTTSTTGPGMYWQGGALFNADQVGVLNDFGAAQIEEYFAFGTGNPDVTALSTTRVNTGTWQHVAATREKSTGIIRILVNGLLETTVNTGNSESLVDAQPPSLGGKLYYDVFYSGFSGLVDELRFWNIVRSEQEISDHLHVRLNGDEPGLVGLWRLDDGEGLVATDSSPSANHAALGHDLAGPPIWVAYGPPALP